MDHVWTFGAPVFGAILVIIGAVLPFKSSRAVVEIDGELALVSAAAAADEPAALERAPSIGKRLFSGFGPRAARNAPATLSEAEAEAEAEVTLGPTLADIGAEARAAHDRAAQDAAANVERAAVLAEEERLAAAAQQERRQRELEEIAVAEEARARAEARARRWYVRLDPDTEAPTIEERMALASWLAIPAPFAAGLLMTAFEQEDVPRVRARIVGALAGGEHFENPLPFQVAYDNGGIEKAAVWEVLAPRRAALPWADELFRSS